ncbi:hypothetical protein E2C01_063229 [Portunus trituberculatus]|uniref:Uncharacterized protein n=1 Tax=Portunus trituberculatus TaxID=210409 RepID=A0A5B7HIE5_PORTR|nr:hypothetical protein [Portunus trituberculatus]
MVTCWGKCSGVTCGVPASVGQCGHRGEALCGVPGQEGLREGYRGVHWFNTTRFLVAREEDGSCGSDSSMPIEGRRCIARCCVLVVEVSDKKHVDVL